MPKHEITEKKPGPSCLFPIVLLTIVFSLIAFYAWQGLRMQKEMKVFTEKNPCWLETKRLPLEKTKSLEKKLELFRAQLSSNKNTSLSLQAQEINHLIATNPLLKPHRHRAFIEKITPEAVTATLCFPMRTFSLSGHRYLAGTATLTPLIQKNQPALEIQTFHSLLKKDVPKEFLQYLKFLPAFAEKKAFKKLRPQLEKITRITLHENHIQIHAK